jgi:hypothetical protein
MPIDFACPCGRRLRVPDRLAGKFARCPACQVSRYIPGPSEVVEEPKRAKKENKPQLVRNQSNSALVQDRPSKPAVDIRKREVVDNLPPKPAVDIRKREVVDNPPPKPAVVIPKLEIPSNRSPKPPAVDITKLEVVNDLPPKLAFEVCELEIVDDGPADRADDVCGLEIVEDSPAEPVAEACELEIVEDSPPELEEEACELEVVEVSLPDPDDDIIDLELADGEPPLDATPLPRRPSAKARPASDEDDDDDDDEEEFERPRKQRKRKKPRIENPEQDKGMALFYGSTSNADLTIMKAELRKKNAWKKQIKWWGQWEEGIKIGGIHINGGIVIGGGMLTTGLLCLAVVWALYMQGMWIPVRLIGAAVAYTVAGLVVLLKGLFSQ